VKGIELMESGANNSDIIQGTLSMVRMPGEDISPETAEIAQIVRLVLAGDTTSFEHIITHTNAAS